MAPQLLCDAHGLQVPYDDGAIYTTRGEVVAQAIEAQTCRMAGANCVGYVLWIVL
jgi:hypothetical protein